MRASTSVTRPPRRSWWIHALWPGLLSLLLVGYLIRGKVGSDPRPRGAAAASVKGSYRNRAVVPPPAAPAGEPAPLPAIRGLVYDAQGGVVPGASVVALSYEVAGNIASRVGAVLSDVGGAFEIPLPAGTYQLNVSKDGYGPTTLVVQTGDTASVVLPRSGTLKGRVLDDKGKPVRRFTIDLVAAVPGDVPAPPPLVSKAIDAEDGAFELGALPAWPVIVRASAEDRAPAFSAPLQVRPDETREVTLTLAKGCAIEGTVVDGAGRPLGGVLVDAEERLTAGSFMDPVIQAAAQVITEDDGAFRLEHVPRGAVMVRGYDRDHAPSSLTVQIDSCDKREPVKLVMSPGGSVEGVARSADGSPLAGARLTLADRLVGIVNTQSDEDGGYRFDGLPAGALRIQIEHDGRSALNFVQVREGAVTHLDMTLFAAGTGSLEGRITAGKSPISGARLVLASNQGREKGVAMFFPVTREDGTFRVEALPIGAYLMSVMSTPAGASLQISDGQTTKSDIDIAEAFAPLPSASDQRPKNRRPRRAAQPAEDAEGATPTP